MQEKTIEFTRNHDKIRVNILTFKSITQEEILTIKKVIYNQLINSDKYNYDMEDYFIKELKYKNIKLYNITYIYYLLNMTNKRAIVNLTY